MQNQQCQGNAKEKRPQVRGRINQNISKTIGKRAFSQTRFGMNSTNLEVGSIRMTAEPTEIKHFQGQGLL